MTHTEARTVAALLGAQWDVLSLHRQCCDLLREYVVQYAANERGRVITELCEVVCAYVPNLESE